MLPSAGAHTPFLVREQPHLNSRDEAVPITLTSMNLADNYFAFGAGSPNPSRTSSGRYLTGGEP